MTSLIAVLLSWITLHTGYVVAEPPAIEFVSPDTMTNRYHQGGHPELSALRVVALYNPQSATVYLAKGWQAADVVDQSKLLHELIHHAQAVNQAPALCVAEWERQAYELQARWLAENGIAEPYDAMQVDALTVKVLSMCGG